MLFRSPQGSQVPTSASNTGKSASTQSGKQATQASEQPTAASQPAANTGSLHVPSVSDLVPAASRLAQATPPTNTTYTNPSTGNNANTTDGNNQGSSSKKDDEKEKDSEKPKESAASSIFANFPGIATWPGGNSLTGDMAGNMADARNDFTNQYLANIANPYLMGAGIPTIETGNTNLTASSDTEEEAAARAAIANETAKLLAAGYDSSMGGRFGYYMQNDPELRKYYEDNYGDQSLYGNLGVFYIAILNIHFNLLFSIPDKCSQFLKQICVAHRRHL